jgi:hypothetical protein
MKEAKKKPPWKKQRPKIGKKIKLSEDDKAAARARAARAGRCYPNLVDNMWAAKRKKDRGVEAD